MDPHLRRHCARDIDEDVCRLVGDSPSGGQFAVIAEVTDLQAFKSERGVKVVTWIESAPQGQTTIVTARIRGDQYDIERLRGQDFVRSLKAIRRVRPCLERSKSEAGLGRQVQVSKLAKDQDQPGGSGVIIGIVDFGLDFVHKNFRKPDKKGSTRILALWDQNGAPAEGEKPHPFGYGRLISSERIDAALGVSGPYKELGYGPSKDSVFDTGAHGTYVTDIAAGNGEGSGCPGFASAADIVFVDLSTSDVPLQGPQSVGNTFGDSVHLLEAVKFIFDFAETRPCVVNLSLTTNGGPHDGTTLVERALDALVREKPNRAIVVAAGNSYDGSIHAAGKVQAKGFVDLGWKIPRFDSTSNELEIWYSGKDSFGLEVFDPDGEFVMRVKPGQTRSIRDDRRGLITAVNRLNDPNNGDNNINVFFESGLRDGVWTIRLCGDRVEDGHFHAWIERDERGQSRFVRSADDSYSVNGDVTLGSIACGHYSITVGSFDAHEAALPLAESSSSGPTRDHRRKPHEKPELSAGGERVLAAQSETLVLRHRQSGTSMAAAVVSGTVALMLAEAHQKREGVPPLHLEIDEIRDILISTARPATSKTWDPRFGYGRVCAAEAVKRVAERRRLETGHPPGALGSSG
jgi:subtilisin family serine protease